MSGSLPAQYHLRGKFAADGSAVSQSVLACANKLVSFAIAASLPPSTLASPSGSGAPTAHSACHASASAYSPSGPPNASSSNGVVEKPPFFARKKPTLG